MKPFNLQEALAGKPVVTRDGRPVKIAGYNPDAIMTSQLLGWVNNQSRTWFSDGQYIDGSEHACDLFMAPTERKEWVVRRGLSTPYVLGPYSSKSIAESVALNYDTIHEITIVE